MGMENQIRVIVYLNVKKSNSENLTCGSSCDPKDKYSCGAASGGCTECAAGGSDSGYGCMLPSK